MKGKPLVLQVLDRIGKDWSKGEATKKKLHRNAREFARFVERTFGLEEITHLKPRHIQAYLESLHDRGLAHSTKADKLTAVRQVAGAIGKQNIVMRENKDYRVNRVRVNPQPVNQEKLCEVLAAIKAKAVMGDRIAIMTMAADTLRETFALRAKESLMSSSVILQDNKIFLVIDGAKGGRPRKLEVKTEAQHRAIQLVIETSKMLKSATGRIIPPEMTLKKAYNAQRNLWARCGGTKTNGANMHARRHAGARRMKAEGATNAEIMNELGHGEKRSPSAYGC